MLNINCDGHIIELMGCHLVELTYIDAMMQRIKQEVVISKSRWLFSSSSDKASFPI